MTRILARLSAFNLLALAVAFTVGWVSRARGSLRAPDDPTYLLHFCLGLFAVISSLAVHCLIFIYFLGTGRWVKEVALAYRIPDVPLPRLTRDLKRRTFPVALLAMVVPMATAVAGGGVQCAGWHWTVHCTLAVASLAVNAWAFWIEHRNVSINVGIVDDVMVEVDRIRAAHGLCSNAEALRQEQG